MDNYAIKVQPYLMEVEKWRRQGLSIHAICKNLKVKEETLRKYRKIYKELDDILNFSLDLANAKVEDALFKNALGYYVEECREEEVKGVVKKITSKRWIPGNTSAQIFWLKNNSRKKWQDRNYSPQELENEMLTELSSLSDEELKELLDNLKGVINVKE